MTTVDGWAFCESKPYKKHRKKYVHDQVVMKSLSERLKSLQAAQDPRRLGDIKIGNLNGAYGLWLSRSVRLLYAVNCDTQEIILLNMGDHKEVYYHA